MKKIVYSVIIIALSIFLIGNAVAEDKLGFINMKIILSQSKAGKAAAEELKKAFEQRKVEIQEQEIELKALKAELEKQRLVLTETAYQEKELEYQKKLRDYSRLVKDSNDEMQLRDKELTKKLIPEILKIVGDIGKKGEYTLILDVASTDGLAYHSKAHDLTKAVIEQFDKGAKK